MRVGLKGLNTEQIMSKIGRANEKNRPNLEELHQRKIESFWSNFTTEPHQSAVKTECAELCEDRESELYVCTLYPRPTHI